MRSWIGWYVLLSTAAWAAPREVAGTVVGPDGKPVAGARVTIRTLDAERHFRADEVTTTDDAGRFSRTVEVEWSDMPGRVFGYYFIEAPGCAAAIGAIGGFRRGTDLRLAAAFEVAGRTIDAQQQPVAGARVTVLGLLKDLGDGYWLNVPAAGIVTPWLITASGPDGAFRLPGLTILDTTAYGGFVLASLSAEANVDGQTLLGAVSRQKYGAGPRGGEPPEVVITLRPALSVRGRVVRADDGQPVAGAKVMLQADPGTAVSVLTPAVTGGDGAFEFPALPQVFQLFAHAEHLDLAPTWVRIGPERDRHKSLSGAFDQVELRLRAWATVTGTVTDQVTGKPPVAPVRLSAQHCAPWSDGRIALRGYGSGCTIGTDGRFECRMAAGPNRIFIRDHGYDEVGTPVLNVPADGMHAAFELQRWRGVLFQFVAPDTSWIKGASLQIRERGKEVTIGNGPAEFWFRSVKEWGEKIELRIIKNKVELLGWTVVEAQPEPWPVKLELTLP